MKEWDLETDIVVIGMGLAGSVAALEASSNNAKVVLLERFYGGGATVSSGGIIYAGGGTKYQNQLGIEDSVENMFNYLKEETNGIVSDTTLMQFCEQSGENIDWLENIGVPFEASLCPFKTSYPTDKYYLYYSGNESFMPYRKKANPAPRGHRVKGKGISGGLLFKHLKEAILGRKNIEVRYQSNLEQIITDNQGKAIGVQYKTGKLSGLFRILSNINQKLTTYYPPLSKIITRYLLKKESKYNKTLAVKARKGVILAAGGFIFNRDMIKQFAPSYMNCLPLGTIGDDGKAINIAQKLNADTAKMDNISAWRFMLPPLAMIKGALVNIKGRRFCNEQLYGASIGKHIGAQPQGKAFLILDKKMIREAKSQLGKQTAYFQRGPMEYLLRIGHKKAKTIGELAIKIGCEKSVLEATIERYNVSDCPFQKDDKMKVAIDQSPFYAFDCSIKESTYFPFPSLTLGGLVVDESSGLVKTKNGNTIDNLYAIGRTAIGVCSENYVSGLSLADCIFSGRRAAMHASNG